MRSVVGVVLVCCALFVDLTHSSAAQSGTSAGSLEKSENNASTASTTHRLTLVGTEQISPLRRKVSQRLVAFVETADVLLTRKAEDGKTEEIVEIKDTLEVDLDSSDWEPLSPERMAALETMLQTVGSVIIQHGTDENTNGDALDEDNP